MGGGNFQFMTYRESVNFFFFGGGKSNFEQDPDFGPKFEQDPDLGGRIRSRS